MKRRRLELVYVLSTKSTYVDKTQRNETVYLWHAWMGHVSNHKLKVMTNNLMLRGQPQLDKENRHSVCRVSIWQDSPMLK